MDGVKEPILGIKSKDRISALQHIHFAFKLGHTLGMSSWHSSPFRWQIKIPSTEYSTRRKKQRDSLAVAGKTNPFSPSTELKSERKKIGIKAQTTNISTGFYFAINQMQTFCTVQIPFSSFLISGKRFPNTYIPKQTPSGCN